VLIYSPFYSIWRRADWIYKYNYILLYNLYIGKVRQISREEAQLKKLIET
jgi:hypothetical protein